MSYVGHAAVVELLILIDSLVDQIVKESADRPILAGRSTTLKTPSDSKLFC